MSQEANEDVPKGVVISQDPDGDGSEYVDPGATVDIVVSAGKPDVMLRSVVGLQKAEAKNLLENDGFTAAARDMNLSQAAFSARIIRLERALGVTLVDRSVRRLTLTREGRAFQPLARSLLVMLGAVADSVDAHRVAGA